MFVGHCKTGDWMWDTTGTFRLTCERTASIGVHGSNPSSVAVLGAKARSRLISRHFPERESIGEGSATPLCISIPDDRGDNKRGGPSD